MSVKIKVSYTEYGELDRLIQCFSIMADSVKVKAKPHKGKYMRAYIELNNERSPSELREMGERAGSGAEIFMESEEGRKLIETFKTP